MQKCISCKQDINDDAVFCPNCGVSQNRETAPQTAFLIRKESFIRLFRPSFFGGLENTSIQHSETIKLLIDFLSLSRALTDEETDELNAAFDILLNNATNEYTIKRRPIYRIASEDNPAIANEKFRYNFISDNLLDQMKQYVAAQKELCAIIWLFALLAALDGHYSDEKMMLFSRIKNLFPVSREHFLMHIKQSIAVSHTSASYGDALTVFFNLLISGKLYDSADTMQKTYNADTPIDTMLADIPEDFDFYDCVAGKIQQLCSIEAEIQKLEQSEGNYAEIKKQIAILEVQEREIIAILPGFEYSKF